MALIPPILPQSAPACSNLEILKNVHMLTFGRFPQIEDKK
jgi:hypothetical protein